MHDRVDFLEAIDNLLDRGTRATGWILFPSAKKAPRANLIAGTVFLEAASRSELQLAAAYVPA